MTNNSQFPSTKPALKERQSLVAERLPVWRLWVPLLLQTGLILAIPAQAFYTQITGKTVVLQTIAVDPYDFLRGYSQTLNYDISRLETLKRLPGWKELKSQNSDYLAAGTKFYVILAAPATSKTPPQPWKPVRVSSDRPIIPANQIAILGKSNGTSSVEYGVETYYMPESRRNEINQDIMQARNGLVQQSVVVEVKVDNQGRAVPMSFWISDRNYRF